MSIILIQEAQKKFKESLHQGKILSFEKLSQDYLVKSEDESTAVDINYYHLLKNWYNEINNLTFLEQDFDGLEEIIIQSPTYMLYKFKETKKVSDCDLTIEDLQTAFEVLTHNAGITWNYEKPFASFYSKVFGKSVRISMSHFSLSPTKQSKVYIRFLNQKAFPLKSFCGEVDLVKNLIEQKYNVLIAGATGSGKTSFLNSALEYVPKKEHLVVLEDTYELISPHNNTSRLLSNPENENTSLNELLSYAMRMSPERLIIGELRGKEVETYLMSINTGHKGVLSTLHANNAVDSLNRLALMFKVYSEKDIPINTILKLLCQNIDYVIFLENKEVKELIKVYSSENDKIFYEDCLETTAPSLASASYN